MSIFSRSLGPSAAAVKAAVLIGQQMAKQESSLQPSMHNAGLYANYSHFRQAHREKMERADTFAKWQERLLELAERDGRRIHQDQGDSMKAWDVWYNQIVQPLKSQMWLAWEAWHDLPRLYSQVKRELPLHAPQPLSPLDSCDRPAPLRVAGLVPPNASQLGDVPHRVQTSSAPLSHDAVRLHEVKSMATGSGIAGNNSLKVDGPAWSI